MLDASPGYGHCPGVHSGPVPSPSPQATSPTAGFRYHLFMPTKYPLACSPFIIFPVFPLHHRGPSGISNLKWSKTQFIIYSSFLLV